MSDHRDTELDIERDPTPPPGAPAEPREAPDEGTIGTGTSIALGCVAGTILLVIIGLIFLLVVMLVG